jgi:exonuclease III
MKFLNFNIRLGGQSRTPQIIDYLLCNDFDMIVLSEFILDKHGKEIIQKLANNGYKTQPSNKEGYGLLIASKKDFKTKKLEDMWAEVYIPEMDLYVLGIYVPDQPGADKSLFWKKIIEYAAKNTKENVLITGDFNSCGKEDSSNGTEYYAKDLMKLEELGYSDLWKCYSKDKVNRYTWFYYSGEGFRLDYAFVSPKLAASLQEVIAYHNFDLRTSKVSDHSALCVNWKKLNENSY